MYRCAGEQLLRSTFVILLPLHKNPILEVIARGTLRLKEG